MEGDISGSSDPPSSVNSVSNPKTKTKGKGYESAITPSFYRNLCLAIADLHTGYKNILLSAMYCSRISQAEDEKKDWSKCLKLARVLAKKYQEFYEMSTNMAQKYVSEEYYKDLRESMKTRSTKLPPVNQNVMLDNFKFEMPSLFTEKCTAVDNVTNAGKQTEHAHIPPETPKHASQENISSVHDSKQSRFRNLEHHKDCALANDLKIKSKKSLAEIFDGMDNLFLGSAFPGLRAPPVTPLPGYCSLSSDETRRYEADKDTDHHTSNPRSHARSTHQKKISSPRESPTSSFQEIPVKSLFISFSKIDVLPGITCNQKVVSDKIQDRSQGSVAAKSVVKLPKIKPDVAKSKKKRKDGFFNLPESTVPDSEQESYLDKTSTRLLGGNDRHGRGTKHWCVYGSKESGK